MRASLGIVTITVLASLIFAAEVRDLGVPAGWRASDYDRHGYDLLNKYDYENARRYFDAAIRTDPNMWTAYFNRATALIRQKKWSAALQDLNTTIRLKPSLLEASFYRAGVNARLGNYRASLSDFDSAIRYEEQAISTAGNAPQEVFESAARLGSKRDAMELAKKEVKDVELRRQAL